MNASWFATLEDLPAIALLGVKITLLLAAAWAAHFALGRLSPRWRVLLWRGVAIGLIMLPLLATLAPEMPIPLLPAVAKETAAPVFAAPLASVSRVSELIPSLETESVTPEPPKTWATLGKRGLLWVAWGVVALVWGLRFLFAQRAMNRVIRRASPAPDRIQRTFEEAAFKVGVRGARLAVSPAVRSPLLHGVRRPVVLLPERMTGEEFAPDLPAIFAHELQHAAARDLAWLGLARVVQILLWPHPLAWRLHAASAAATERATDAAAARALADREGYSRSLARVALALAGRPVQSVALAMAIPDIRRRLNALKRNSAGRSPRREAVMLAAGLALGFVIMLGTFKPVRAETKKAGPPPGQYANGGIRGGNTGQRATSSTQEMVVCVYKINEKDGPRIKTLIDSLISHPGKRENRDRRVIYNGNDLIIRDTAENIKKVEAMLREQKWVQENAKEKLDTAHFSLVPRDTNTTTTQAQVFGDRAVDAIKDFLYPLKTEAQADAAGRRFWYDRPTMQLTITDTTPRLERVRQYIGSLPELSATRQDVIFLKYGVAEKMAGQLEKEKWPGLTINPFGELNALVVRHTDPDSYRKLLEEIAKLDRPEARAGEGKKSDVKNAPEIITRIYKINEKDGPRIKSLVDPIISARSGKPFDLERKISIDKEDLIVRDTPENIVKIEELLRDKKLTRNTDEERLNVGKKLEELAGKEPDGNEIVFERRTGEAITWRDLAIRILAVNDGPGREGTVELEILDGYNETQLNLAELTTHYFKDYRISVEEVVGSGQKGEGRARIRISQARQEGTQEKRATLFLKYAVAEEFAQKLRDRITSEKGNLEGVKVDAVPSLNGIDIRYQKPESYQRVGELIKELDKPTRQVSLETRLIQENTTVTRAQGRPFDPLRELGLELRKCLSGQRKDRTARPVLKEVTMPVLASGGKTRYQEMNQRLSELKAAGRIRAVNGPRVTSLDGQEAVFRIEMVDKSAPPPPGIGTTRQELAAYEKLIEGFLSSAVVMRMTPRIDEKTSGIHLTQMSLYLLFPKENRRSTQKEFDAELKDGEAILLTAPEFEGFHVLLTAYIVE